MSLKAGRVGVNPADVDPVSGHITPAASDSYTKAQSDDKFLSKSDASSTYLSKSDAASTYETKTAAADLQPKTLSVPITMLDGSKLTVESALGGLNDGKGSFMAVSDTQGTETPEGATVSNNKISKFGKVVFIDLDMSAVSVDGGGTLCKIPSGYRPAYTQRFLNSNNQLIEIDVYGTVRSVNAISNTNCRTHFSWITA